MSRTDKTGQPSVRADDGDSGLPEPARLQGLLAQILDEARARGASAAEASISASLGLRLSVRRGEVEQLTQNRDRGLNVSVYFGHSKGSAATADWRPEAMREAVAAACEGARHTAADPANGLAEPELLARDIPDLDLDHPWPLQTDDAIELARECEAAAFDADRRIDNSEGASVASSRAVQYYANSHGFCAGYPSSRHALGCSVIARDDSGGDPAMQRGYRYAQTRDPAELEEAAEVGRTAAERAVARLGSRRLDTRSAPVLFEAEIARSLIGHFAAAISGSALYRKASFLRDRLGEAVFADGVTISERPHIPKALGSAPFDRDGVATKARELVEGGVLQGYLLGAYSARRLGLTTTGNADGPHNLLVAPGRLDRAELLRELDRGLLVTQLMGQGVNMINGDYSRAAVGFWVEDGAIQYPVEEITIAGNLPTMFRGLREIGRDVDRRGVIQTGSLLIDELVIAGRQ